MLGAIDTLVACAGVMYSTLMANAKMDQCAQTVNVNCTGFLNTIGCAVPRMLARGPSHPCHIVAISSDAGQKVFPGLGVYSASKFFVEATLQSLQLETVGSGLRVTSIQLGNVETSLQGMSTDKEAVDRYAGVPHEGEEPARILWPADVADAILWALKQSGHVAVNEVLIEPREQPT